ncbi:hypothetical protein [Salinibacter sp. 10B]|uniref:hypothetical protein n=1 Tax=Salinibacter sp. 10B TaxID=1923971 RepID=UPI0011AFF926|nr:hypothetical protein [Salinibacter sp. 10B]
MQLSILLVFATFMNPLVADDSIRAEKVLTLSDTLAKHEIFEPRALTFADDGTVYLFDDGAKRIHVFDSDFNHQFAFGREGPGPGEFERTVMRLLVSSAGELVALEKWDRTVHFFSLDGVYRDSFFIQKDLEVSGTPQSQGFGIPLDVALDDKNRIYLTDRVWYYNRDKVQVFNREGEFVESFLPQDRFRTYEQVQDAHSTPKRRQERVATLMNDYQIRLDIDQSGNVIVGHRGDYVLEKYSPDFERVWRRELAFDPVKQSYAAEIAHMGSTGYSAFMGEGAVADIETNADNEIFVSVGTFDGSLDENRRSNLNHWIDVFDADGTHLARLLEDKLPPVPSRRGYQIDVHDGRLLVLGGTELWAYRIVREQ